MAAREDETETVVGNGIGIEGESGGGGIGGGVERSFEAGAAAEPVDGFVTSGLEEPGEGIGRESGGVPLGQGGGEGFLSGVFGEIEVGGEPEESGDDAAVVGAVELGEGGVEGGVQCPMINKVAVRCRLGGA